MKFSISYDAERDEEVRANFHSECELSRKLCMLMAEKDSVGEIQAFDEEGFCEISVSDIECVTVLEGKTYAVCGGKKLLVRRRLYEMEKILPDYFIKINKSTIANEKRIRRFSVGFSEAAGKEHIILILGIVEYGVFVAQM